MKYFYPVNITFNKNIRKYIAEIVGTYENDIINSTLTDVLEDARDSLTFLLNENIEKGEPLFKPQVVHEQDTFYIRPHDNATIALNLREARIERFYSIQEMAKILDIYDSEYTELEDIMKSNPTIKMINRLEYLFNQKLNISDTDMASWYFCSQYKSKEELEILLSDHNTNWRNISDMSNEWPLS